MMKTFLITVFAAASITAVAQDGNFTVSRDASDITWTGKKVTGEHTGKISPSKGVILVKNGKITGGDIAIDMKSLTVTDLEGEWNQKLAGHLHSDDFFSTEQFPVASLKIDKATPIKSGKGQYTHQIEGKLTIKGITHPVSFPAVVEIKDNKLAAAGEMKVDRTLYDIRYGSSNFFEGLGDKAIDNEFLLKFKVGASS